MKRLPKKLVYHVEMENQGNISSFLKKLKIPCNYLFDWTVHYCYKYAIDYFI